MPALLSPYSLHTVEIYRQCRKVSVGLMPFYSPEGSQKEQPQHNSRLNCHLRDIWQELTGAAETLDLILPPIQMECWAAFLSLFGF